MSRIVAVLIIAGYLLIGVFVSGVLDDDMNPAIVAFWPFIVVMLALFGVCWFALKAGKNLGKLIWRD